MFIGHHGPQGPAVFFLILQVLIVAGIATLAVASLRLAFGSGRAGRTDRADGGPAAIATQPGAADAPATAPTQARAILDERLARGEIDVKDYQARLKALGEEPPSA